MTGQEQVLTLYSLLRVVEFSQPEEAQKAIRELTDQTLLGRPIFVREVSMNKLVLSCV